MAKTSFHTRKHGQVLKVLQSSYCARSKLVIHKLLESQLNPANN